MSSTTPATAILLLVGSGATPAAHAQPFARAQPEKDFRLGNFAPVISEIVAAEIAPAPQEVRDQYAELLQW